MPTIKGKKEYERFQKDESLTRKEAILAQCYSCSEGKDCQSETCPLYPFMPYRDGLPKKQISEKHRKQLETLNRGK